MQKYRLTTMAGLAALAIASTASAQTNTILRITGSTAFRTVALNAIKSMITPGSLKYGYGGTTFGSSSYAEFVGALAASPNVTVDVKTVWSGSVDGLQRVIFNGNPSFENNNWLASSSLSSTGTPGLAAGTEVAYADAAFCDNFQNSTIFQNPQVQSDTIVGVVPFEWCRNAGAPTTMSNMTSMLAQQILAAGSLTLKCWTGNPSDDSTLVYVVGRNYDSGTRVDTYSETGFGVSTPPNQSAVFSAAIGTNIVGGVTNVYSVITNMVPYPAETVDTLPFALGQSGYSSGGLVSGALNAFGSDSSTNTGNKGWIAGYLGVSDANNVTNGTAGPMTWNGVAYSPANVNNGQYTFWSYEHQVNNNNLSANQQTILNALVSTIESEDPTAFGGISLSSMTVGRSQEGSPVSDGRAY